MWEAKICVEYVEVSEGAEIFQVESVDGHVYNLELTWESFGKTLV